ncbi:DUF302 domain-containing protein [Ferroplasma acidiphilum]|jgi:uncharacterized protein (DUF302 family)|uniref:DUF302 domain-containing protein n=1 Tax=Ferroplasma acidiphilum TaxID=74969 RepID=A0A1V0N4U0_9ARCH|nr:DUF302 domain-containing protein [Ferroplasma acidiphilum]ARD85143.1 hypothetical protein FAD_1275 [Ferroplasma acidiphilum]MCL4349024.1 DUF302 domain-containing protein [Candidatus Thermoplasmatota archaeon]WMT54086.1 MAG: DUF302 domain-containing protein [Ferroplasma acidiphilum]
MFLKYKSVHTFEETVKLATDFIKSKGITVFSIVDHRKNADNAGLEMQNETLILFGSPVVGTLLMKENPEIGIELPSKLLIYSTNSDVYILYKDPEEFLKVYAIRESTDAIEKLKMLYKQIVEQVI